MRISLALALVLGLGLVACDADEEPGSDAGRGGDGAVTPPPPGTPPPAGGDGLAGSPCATAADCTAPVMGECFTTVSGGGFVPDMLFPGGYCSRGCAEDPEGGSPPVDCGPGASCAMLSSSGGMISTTFAFCARTCMTPADCRTAEGYTCKITFPGFPGICTPPGL